MDRFNIIWIHQRLAGQRIFTPDDLLKDKKRKAQLRNLLFRETKRKRIKRIWKGLYHLVLFENPSWQPSPLEIAVDLCKRNHGCIYSVSALEAAGLLHPSSSRIRAAIGTITHSRTIHIRAPKGGTAITHKSYAGTTFLIHRYTGKIAGVQEISLPEEQGKGIILPITIPEETFVECTNHIELTLASTRTIMEFLDLFRGHPLDIPLTIARLESRDSFKLNAKVGLLLEILGAGISHPRLIERLSKSLSKKTYYFRKPHKRYIGLAKEHFKHIARWRLMVPNSLYTLYQLEMSKPGHVAQAPLDQLQATIGEEAAPVEISYTTTIPNIPIEPQPTTGQGKDEKKTPSTPSP